MLDQKPQVGHTLLGPRYIRICNFHGLLIINSVNYNLVRTKQNSPVQCIFQDEGPEPITIFETINLDEAKYLLGHFVQLAISKVGICNFVLKHFILSYSDIFNLNIFIAIQV